MAVGPDVVSSSGRHSPVLPAGARDTGDVRTLTTLRKRTSGSVSRKSVVY